MTLLSLAALSLLLLLLSSPVMVHAETCADNQDSCTDCTYNTLACGWCKDGSCVESGMSCLDGSDKVVDPDRCVFVDSNSAKLAGIVVGSILGGFAFCALLAWMACGTTFDPCWRRCRGGRAGTFCCVNHGQERIDKARDEERVRRAARLQELEERDQRAARAAALAGAGSSDALPPPGVSSVSSSSALSPSLASSKEVEVGGTQLISVAVMPARPRSPSKSKETEEAGATIDL
jgi:hypothetical protein